MLDRPHPGPALLRETTDGTAGALRQTEHDSMADYAEDEHDKARRFRDAALPYLDDAYALARYLLRNPADAEDAVQECYLRAFRHFDSFRGTMIKPWLLAILRNVCRAEYARRSEFVAAEGAHAEAVAPLWVEAQDSPETAVLRQLETETVQRLVDKLPDP